ncbi:hypothetical protein AAHC03_018949 [Spirometra sp. Aus1]
MSTVPGQLANLMAGYLLRRLTSITETVSSYLGPPQTSPLQQQQQPPSQSQTEKESCLMSSLEANADNGPMKKACLGRKASQVMNHWEGDLEASPGNGSPRGLVIKEPGKQAGQNGKQIAARDGGRPGCNCCRLTGHRSPPVEPLHNGQSAGGRATDIAGHLRPAEEVTDWCRWPVCAVFRWGGQCPLGEYQCPDAHAGREYLSQIDSNGLVRVCFESLGLVLSLIPTPLSRQFSCTLPPHLFPLLKKPCTRPIGCCRFFHPPEHIRLALIRSRHAATAHAASVRRRQQKAYAAAASQEDRCLPRQLRQVAARSPPSTAVQQSELRISDQNALEAIKLLSGLMDYGQLLRICAAIVMREHDAAAAAPATEEEKSSEMAVAEPLKGYADKQEVELAAAAAVNRQLTAYSNLTEALRAQLALSSKKAI